MNKRVYIMCAGGMSSSALARLAQNYFDEKAINLTIEAHSVSLAKKLASKTDLILLAPQVSFMLKNVINDVEDTMVAVIPMMVYGRMQVENLYQQIESIFNND